MGVYVYFCYVSEICVGNSVDCHVLVKCGSEVWEEHQRSSGNPGVPYCSFTSFIRLLVTALLRTLQQSPTFFPQNPSFQSTLPSTLQQSPLEIFSSSVPSFCSSIKRDVHSFILSRLGLQLDEVYICLRYTTFFFLFLHKYIK